MHHLDSLRRWHLVQRSARDDGPVEFGSSGTHLVMDWSTLTMSETNAATPDDSFDDEAIDLTMGVDDDQTQMGCSSKPSICALRWSFSKTVLSGSTNGRRLPPVRSR